MLDFGKAFDSVLWLDLGVVLHHFSFGSTFRAWVKTFYHQTLVNIMLNGSPGDTFVLGAGVRQGDSLSHGLFALYIEPMMRFYELNFQTVVSQSTTPPSLTCFRRLLTIAPVN